MSEWSLKSQINNSGAKGPFDVDGTANTIVFTTERIDQVQQNNSTVNVSKGVVKVFVNLSGQWAKLGDDIESNYYNNNPTSNIPTNFGHQVKISEDGTIIAIGEPNYSITLGTFCGRVQIYKLVGLNWVQLGQDLILLGQGNSYERFGNAISLSPDGKRIAVGSSGLRGGIFPENYGNVKVYEYRENDSQWTQIGNTIWNSSYQDRIFNPSARVYSDGIAALPESIELSNNGDLIIGRPLFGPSEYNYQGKVDLYKYLNGWQKTYSYERPGTSKVGRGVSITKDGSIFSVLIDPSETESIVDVFFKTENPNSVLFPTIEKARNATQLGNSSYYDFSVVGNLMRLITYDPNEASINSAYNAATTNPADTWTRYVNLLTPNITNNTAKLSKETSNLVVVRNDFNIYVYDVPLLPPTPTPTQTRTPTRTPQPTNTPTKTAFPTPTATVTQTPTTTQTQTTTPSATKCYELEDGLNPDQLYDIQNNQTLEEENQNSQLTGNGGDIVEKGYKFGPNQGLTLFNSLENIEEYSLSIDFEIDQTTNPVKIIDFKNQSFNNGIYYLPTSSTTGKMNLRFEPINNIVSDIEISTLERNRLTIVRKFLTVSENETSFTNQVFIVYLNNQQIFQVIDSEEFGVPDNNVFQFFIDDVYSSSEAGGGIVYRIATYNSDLSAGQCLLESLPTPTPTVTPTTTLTPTSTETPLPTVPLVTQSKTAFPTQTPTQTSSPGASPTPTASQTQTPTQTSTGTQTPTPTATQTQTPSVTITKTRVSRFARGLDCCVVDLSPTPTASVTASVTQTPTHTPTNTATQTQTPTNTASQTQTPTNTASQTQTPTKTPTHTPTHTPTQTIGLTPTPTQTPTTTTTLTATPTSTTTLTATPTQTQTPGSTPAPLDLETEFIIFIEPVTDGYLCIELPDSPDDDVLTSKSYGYVETSNSLTLSKSFPVYGINSIRLVQRGGGFGSDPYYELNNSQVNDISQTYNITHDTLNIKLNRFEIDMILKFNYWVRRVSGTGFVKFKLRRGSAINKFTFTNFELNAVTPGINPLYPSAVLASISRDYPYQRIKFSSFKKDGNDSKYYKQPSIIEYKNQRIEGRPNEPYKLIIRNDQIKKIIKFPDVVKDESGEENVFGSDSYVKFENCNNLTEVPSTLGRNVSDLSRMFYGCTRINDPNIGDWDVSNVVNMQSMFYNAVSFNQSLEKWKPIKTQNMSDMFRSALSFNNKLFTETPELIYIDRMFADSLFNNETISNLKTQKVLSMEETFARNNAFNQDLSNWDASLVQTMKGMFSRAIKFNSGIPYNTFSLVNASQMFMYAETYNGGDNPVLNLYVTNVTDMDQMFFNAVNFKCDISLWDIDNVYSAESMFHDARSFPGTNIDRWTTKSLKYANNMFNGAIAFQSSLANWDISRLERAEEFMLNVNLKNFNYTRLLESWANKTRKQDVVINLGKAKKTSSDMINNFNKLAYETFWIITDGDGINES